MKKSCDNCKAYNNGCDLGYNVGFFYKKYLSFGGVTLKHQKPLESCPKPTTYSVYLTLMGH